MKEKRRIIIYTILIVLACIIISLCLFAKNQFGNPQYEQLIFSLLLSKGSSWDVIFSGVLYCLPIVLVGSLCFLPFLYIDLTKLKINFFKFYKGLYTSIIFIGSLIYAFNSIGLFSYLYAQTKQTSLFDNYYVEPKEELLTFPEKKKNLIYIAVESFESSYAYGFVDDKKVNLIPNMYALAKDNVNFSASEDVGGAKSINLTTWTAAGTIAQLSGLPIKTPLFDHSYGKDGKFLPGATMIGDILYENGYKSYYLSGGDAAFAAHDALFESHGNYEILDYVWAKDTGLIPEDYYEFWGFEDKKLYSFAKDKLLEISKEEEPFNLFMATVDTHVVDGYLDETCKMTYDYQYASVINCADKMLSEFISWVQKQDFYENTVIVISGDHITMQTDIKDYLVSPNGRSIYNVIINGEGDKINTKNREFTTLDMFPTTLASMGVKINGDRLGLGTNLYSGKKTLLEEIGYNKLNDEIVKDSKYYNEAFLKGE